MSTAPMSAIARDNDALRIDWPLTRLGDITFTVGVKSLLANDGGGRSALLDELLSVEFNETNDPYGEHDFGTFYFAGNKCFFKIDYYESASCDRWANPAVGPVWRQMTVMLAEEY